MSDDPTQHDELRRRLAEQGAASAPPDLADEVMRRVRAEPRRRERPAWLRPTLGLVAAAVLVVAALAGISRINAGTSSGSSSAAPAIAGPASSGERYAPEPGSANKALVKDVPAAQLRHLLGNGAASGAVPGAMSITCQPARVDVRVPSAVYDSLQAQLRQAAASGSAARRVTVVLHRGGTAVRTLRVTCP